jgi:hypothetical protein
MSSSEERQSELDKYKEEERQRWDSIAKKCKSGKSSMIGRRQMITVT